MQGSGRNRMRLAVVVVLALAMGVLAATALARHGADDGPEGTTGTTGTTQTTTTPAAVGDRIRIKGRVVEREPAEASFVVKVRSGALWQVVDAPRVPRVGCLVVVPGILLDDDTVDATRVRVKHRHRHHGDDDRDRRGCEPGDDCGGLRDDDDHDRHDDDDDGDDHGGDSGPGPGGSSGRG